MSPTRFKGKEKKGTPKVGQKRKRNALPSPPAALTDSPGMIASPARQQLTDDALIRAEADLAKLEIKDERFHLVQTVLSHQSHRYGKQTLEALATYCIPGLNEPSLATLMLNAMSRLASEDTMPTSVAIRSICLDIWEMCLAHKYWPPLSLVLELMMSMLRTEDSSRQTMLAERTIILSVRTYVIVAEPRVQQSKLQNKSKGGHDQQSEDIDDFMILSLLHTIAMSSALETSKRDMFWRRLEFQFPLLVLQRTQPLAHIHLMLQMISASVQEDSFGPRHHNEAEQAQQEASLLDRITCLLYQKIEPEQPAESILDMRLVVLHTLRGISGTARGTNALSQHKQVIGRLIRFLCDQIAMLYVLSPITVSPAEDDEQNLGDTSWSAPSRHGMTTSTINLTTRILYHLLHEQDVKLLEKLAVIHGGNQKFIIAFSRLACSERLLLEAGLEPEVVEAASEILDAIFTPEEGEAVVDVMEMSQGARSGRASLPAMSAPE